MQESQIKIAQDVRNKFDDVLTFYSKEDFKDYLDELNSARLNGTSDFKYYQSQLRKMFKARNIKGYEEILEKSFDANTIDGQNIIDSILKKVPTRDEIILKLVQEMYKIYSQFPSAQNYMSELVGHLTGDSSSDESLRLKILKQFLRNTNYHTNYVIEKVVEKLPPEERQKYDGANTTEAKLEIILANIDDSIFEEENYLNFSDWQKFFSIWLNSGYKEFFEITKKFIIDKNSTTEELEKQFYNYLNDNYKLVSDGKIKSGLGEVYKNNKVDFVKKKAPLLEIIGAEKIISWNLKAYSKWIIQWIDKEMPESELINPETKENLLNLAREIGAIQKCEVFDVLTLLEKISATNNNFNSSASRCRCLKKVEDEIIESCGVNCGVKKDILEQKKLAWILENYSKAIDAELKRKFFGNLGLSDKSYSNFLKDQIAIIDIAPLKISDELRTKIQTALPEIVQLTDAQIVLKLATVQNFVFPKEDEANLTSELIKSTSNYLKQINILQNNKRKNFGLIFDQAVKDMFKNRGTDLLKISRKLAEIDFSPQDKKMLYLFAFAFDMEYGGEKKESNIENLFDKVFSANSFRNFVKSDNFQLNCEGINIKNYVEICYLWALNQKKLSTAKRLEKAEKFIDKCFKDAKKDKILTQAMPTDFYKKNVAQILKQDEKNFKSFLLKNYRIFSDDTAENNSRILMAPLQNTARKKFIELAQKIRESFDPIHKVAATTDKQGKKIYDADNEVQYAEVDIKSLLPEDNYPKEFQNLFKNLSEILKVDENIVLDEEKILEIEESLEKLSKFFQVDKNIILNEKNVFEIKALLEKLSEILKVDENIVLYEKKIPAIKKSLENLTETLKTILEFQKLLKKLNETVQVGKRGLLLDEEKITTLKNFTRTDLIALYYSYFVQSTLMDFLDDSNSRIDWESLYNAFTAELDTYLTECYFQPFNAKNLYDQFIFFALMLEILN